MGLLVNGCPSFFKIFENFDIIFGSIYHIIQIKEYRYQSHSFCVEIHVRSNEISRFSLKGLVFEKISIENGWIFIKIFKIQTSQNLIKFQSEYLQISIGDFSELREAFFMKKIVKNSYDFSLSSKHVSEVISRNSKYP